MPRPIKPLVLKVESKEGQKRLAEDMSRKEGIKKWITDHHEDVFQSSLWIESEKSILMGFKMQQFCSVDHRPTHFALNNLKKNEPTPEKELDIGWKLGKCSLNKLPPENVKEKHTAQRLNESIDLMRMSASIGCVAPLIRLILSMIRLLWSCWWHGFRLTCPNVWSVSDPINASGIS